MRIFTGSSKEKMKKKKKKRGAGGERERLISLVRETLLIGQYPYLAASKLAIFNLCSPKARIKDSEPLT